MDNEPEPEFDGVSRKRGDDDNDTQVHEMIRDGDKLTPDRRRVLGTCRVCKGKIVMIVSEFWSTGDRFGGPRSRVREHGPMHCDHCGILYHKVPQKIRARRVKRAKRKS